MQNVPQQKKKYGKVFDYNSTLTCYVTESMHFFQLLFRTLVRETRVKKNDALAGIVLRL